VSLQRSIRHALHYSTCSSSSGGRATRWACANSRSCSWNGDSRSAPRWCAPGRRHRRTGARPPAGCGGGGSGGAARLRLYTDQAFIKVHGVWDYLRRAVDGDGNLVDSMPSTHRDMDARVPACGCRFFTRSLEMVGHALEEATTDGREAHSRAIRGTLGPGVRCRCLRYLHNKTEQDYRGTEGRYRPMRGFGSPVQRRAPGTGLPNPRDSFRDRARIHEVGPLHGRGAAPRPCSGSAGHARGAVDEEQTGSTLPMRPALPLPTIPAPERGAAPPTFSSRPPRSRVQRRPRARLRVVGDCPAGTHSARLPLPSLVHPSPASDDSPAP